MTWDETTPLSAANLNGLEIRISDATISVTNGKETIADAITAKGVPSTKDDTFAEMATKINQIDQGKWYESGSVNISSSGHADIIVSGGKRAGVFIISENANNYVAVSNTYTGNIAKSNTTLKWFVSGFGSSYVSVLSTGYSGSLYWHAWGE